MANDFQKRLDSVTETVLTPLVRSAVKDENIEICDWTIQTLKAGAEKYHDVEGMVHFSGHACYLGTGEKAAWFSATVGAGPKPCSAPTTASSV